MPVIAITARVKQPPGPSNRQLKTRALAGRLAVVVVFTEITSFGRLPRTCAPTLVWLPSVRKFPWATRGTAPVQLAGGQHQPPAEAPVARALEGGAIGLGGKGWAGRPSPPSR
jgi:hypothetical protein